VTERTRYQEKEVLEKHVEQLLLGGEVCCVSHSLTQAFSWGKTERTGKRSEMCMS